MTVIFVNNNNNNNCLNIFLNLLLFVHYVSVEPP